MPVSYQTFNSLKDATTPWDICKYLARCHHEAVESKSKHFPSPAQLLKANETIEHFHDCWLEDLENNPDAEHPLLERIKEWASTRKAKKVSAEYDRIHPVGIVKSGFSNVRDLTLGERDTDQLAKIAGIYQPPDTHSQINIPDMEPESKIPEILSLHVASNIGLTSTTKSGAVSLPIRIFFEALMALDPRETRAELQIQLGDLLTFLNPNRYNRTNHLPHVVNALHSLQNATIPYVENPGGPGLWIPVRPVNLPTRESKNDFPIRIDVSLPPDATAGAAVEKSVMRLLGKKSAPRFSAYLVACSIFDKYATSEKGLARDSKPIERRDSDGWLLNADGNRILTRSGKPIKNAYKADALRVLDREINLHGIQKYPILPFTDLIKACFPSGYPPKEERHYLKRAKKYWESMEADGIIRIQKHWNGWRILPSESHYRLHKAVRVASETIREFG